MKSFVKHLAIFLLATSFSAAQCFSQDTTETGDATTSPQSSSAIAQDGTSTDSVSDSRPDSKRAVLGATFIAQQENVLVESVYTNGPLYKMDVQSGDTISKIADTAVRSSQDVDRILKDKNPGDSIAVTWIRDGKTDELSVLLISREELMKVSNTDGQPMANLSRQYVRLQPTYSSDILEKVDGRLQMMEQEIKRLREEIETLRKQASDQAEKQ